MLNVSQAGEYAHIVPGCLLPLSFQSDWVKSLHASLCLSQSIIQYISPKNCDSAVYKIGGVVYMV